MDIKPLLVVFWFGATFTSLIFSGVLLIYTSTPKYTEPLSQNFTLYAALPENSGFSESSIDKADARAKIVENFFNDNKSVLAPYAQTFVDVADKYKLDFRLLPAISMQESNGGRRVIKNSHNPFGFGIYGSKALKFSSWEEGIEIVGQSLRENYLDQGLTTPDKIMAKYTPPSVALGGPWAKGVNTFMEELR